ncbi:MAG: ligand-binding protein SH3 [Desulfobacterales bacterium RIFOXYA12_FULL_46_15]|nr:MAG: ligand-binding protein SH3 [Desulfobacula sp. GWF2_41_7]OGR26946.1 MAG: ligand-binding protein SH3 [Desulfobacterales bacterium RIFOXYA12_FULL_46_15]
MIKKAYQCLLIPLFWLVLFAGISFSEDMFVAGVTEISLRTGPNVENKIIAMLKTGDKLEVIEHQKNWSQVKAAGGKSGWVLSRFITPKKPDTLLYDELKEKNQSLLSKIAQLEEANKSLTVKIASVVEIEAKYKKLQQDSTDFLKLDAKYNESVRQNEAQKAIIEKLETNVESEPKLWFLIGPGVFIVGLFFGLSSRKKRRSSLL